LTTEILYKYMSPSLIDAGYFDNPTLRFTPWNELNDIFELSPIFITPKFDEQYIRSCVKGHNCIVSDTVGRKKLKDTVAKSMCVDFDCEPIFKMLDTQYATDPNFLDHFLSGLSKSGDMGLATGRRASLFIDLLNSDKVGILSVSKIPHSILCWSYYNLHAGYAVGFNSLDSYFSTSFFNNKLLTPLFNDVNYTPTRPYSYPSKNTNKMMADIFLSKGLEWKHEREKRLSLHKTMNILRTK